MLSATPYKEQGYPPRGRQRPRFGDPKLDEAMASISQEMHSNLTQKKLDWRQIHMDHLKQMGLSPAIADAPRSAPRGPMRYQMDDNSETEEYQDAMETPEMEAPSKMQRMARGASRVAKDYVWPVTRDIVAPAMGDMAMGGLSGAAWLTGKAFWTVFDVLQALGVETPPDEDGGTPSIGYDDPHGALGNGASSSSNPREEEVERLSKKSKTALMEEIYKKPGWASLFGRTDSKGYTKDDKGTWRQKMRDMSQRDLAEVLVQL